MILTLFFLSSLLSQAPAATFEGGEVSVRELDEYLAWKYGKREEGQAAQKHLSERALVEREAASRGLAIPKESVAAKLGEMDAALGPGGLDRELRDKQMSREEFLQLLTISFLHERMAREDLGLPAGEKPAPEQLQLWLADRAKRSGALPTPAAESLGRTIRTLLGAKNTKAALFDLIGAQLMETRAREAGLSISEKEIDEEIEKKRTRIRADPRYEGLSFEELLKTQGLDPQALRESPGLRASILLEKLARANWPAERLEAQYEKERARYDGLWGESRRAYWIAIRGTATPSQNIRRSLEDAAREAESLKGRIHSFEDFQRLAKIYSEDERSKSRGGEIGFVHRQEPQIDPSLLEAIASAPTDALAGPVRIASGAALLWVGESKPAPPRAELLEKVLGEKRASYYEDMMRGARVKTFLD